MSGPPKTSKASSPYLARGLRAGFPVAVLLGALAAFGASAASAQTFDLFSEHNRRARDLVERGRLDEAVAEWREALKVAPNNVTVRRNLGIVLLRLGRVEEAEEVLLEAVSLEPNHATTHLYLGRTYLRQGKARLAEAELKTAQQLDPTEPEIDISLAVLAARRGRHGAAEAHLQRALTFNYNDPDLHAALGDVYRARGSWEKAERAYRTALSLDALHLGAKRGLQETEAGRRRASARAEERHLLGALRVENPTTRIEGGRFVVEGQVVNTSERATAKYVIVTCQFYGPQQRIIAEKDTRSEPDTLGPGQRGAWRLSVPYNPEFSGQMEIGARAFVEYPEAERAPRQAAKGPAGAPSRERATFFGGSEVSKGDVLKVSIPKLATEGGKTVLSGYVLNVGDQPVASIDLNFRIVDRATGRHHTQQYARIDRQILEPGERTDYTLDWEEGLDLNRFRLQMKIAWAELFEPSAEGPSAPPPKPEAPPPPEAPRARLPSPVPAPLPTPPRR